MQNSAKDLILGFLAFFPQRPNLSKNFRTDLDFPHFEYLLTTKITVDLF